MDPVLIYLSSAQDFRGRWQAVPFCAVTFPKTVKHDPLCFNFQALAVSSWTYSNITKMLQEKLRHFPEVITGLFRMSPPTGLSLGPVILINCLLLRRALNLAGTLKVHSLLSVCSAFLLLTPSLLLQGP